jgi:hypothetical protein
LEHIAVQPLQREVSIMVAENCGPRTTMISAIVSCWWSASCGRQGVEAKSELSTISPMPWLP